MLKKLCQLKNQRRKNPPTNGKKSKSKRKREKRHHNTIIITIENKRLLFRPLRFKELMYVLLWQLQLGGVHKLRLQNLGVFLPPTPSVYIS